MTTQDKNKIIAEFMGTVNGYDYKSFKSGSWEFQTPEKLRTFIKFEHNNEYFNTTLFKAYECKFNSDWNWLMEAVIVCFDRYDEVHDKSDNQQFLLNDALLETDIKKLHEAVFNFIQWYNLNKKIK